MTIDMKTGKRIYLDDIMKLESHILLSYDYGVNSEFVVPINERECERILKEANESEKEYLLEKNDDNFVSISHLYGKATFYLKEGCVVIIRNYFSNADIFICDDLL